MIAGENGIFGKANESKLKTMMSSYREEVNLYTSWKVMETMNADTSKINSGEPLKTAVQQAIATDISEEDVTTNIDRCNKRYKKRSKKICSCI